MYKKVCRKREIYWRSLVRRSANSTLFRCHRPHRGAHDMGNILGRARIVRHGQHACILPTDRDIDMTHAAVEISAFPAIEPERRVRFGVSLNGYAQNMDEL